VSPETAAASALAGVITDPRDLDMAYPKISDPEKPILNTEMLLPPLPLEEARKVKLHKGPNIASLPALEALPEGLELPVVLKAKDDTSTDEIMPAGARVLPYRSNIPKISEFAFDMVDETYPRRAMQVRDAGGHAVVGGRNYGQGSSREHAALVPRYLGLRVVIAKSFARIHWQNLVNFGVLPVTLEDESEYDRIDQGDLLKLTDLHEQIRAGSPIRIENRTKNRTFKVKQDLSGRQIDVLLAGGLINWVRKRLK